MGIMQDDMCHPNILSTTVLSDVLKQIISNKDIGMVSSLCIFAGYIMTPCHFLFGASSHPYIPLHFEGMIFTLVIT